MKHHHNHTPVVIADTQHLTREGLRSILQPHYPGVRSVSGREELQQVLHEHPRAVIVTDFILFDFLSIKDIGELKKQHEAAGIVIVTNAINQYQIKELNDAGIKTIVLKKDDEEEILHAVGSGLKGKKYYSGSVLDVLLRKEGPQEETYLLTTSEIDIVRLISAGLSTKEIASRKHISFHTVMTHRKNIFRKLGVSSSTELILYAIKAGLIDNIAYHI